MNRSRSKFLEKTWPISQLITKPPLFQLGQDYVTIEKLLALGTGLGTMGTQRKTAIDASKVMYETTATKNKLKASSSPHRYFIKHLTSVIEKPPCEST
jgi:hypothetical protein